MNFLIEIAYDGSKFYGFQRLNEHVSVQKVLEDALFKINKKEVLVKGAGRTDRGVHAYGQCVSFKLDVNIDEDGLYQALNSLVAPYIYVRNVKMVSEDIHARFSVKEKTYRYIINMGEYDPVKADYEYQCPYKLDISKMKDVAKLFLGVHDFHNFVSGERDDYTCIVHSIDFEEVDNKLHIVFKGKSFYRYMVRNLVGAMIEVARGKVDISVVEEMLNTEKEMTIFTAPACGLYLEKIEY
ncbi:MAG: tRNA pseudouridine(38-40) synthase TruA [Bacilli bacterium]|nr:tRNA pseudouridine(38-40) synthase TruA [Bacilli bacterium]